jgi:hypothetical protein
MLSAESQSNTVENDLCRFGTTDRAHHVTFEALKSRISKPCFPENGLADEW